MTLPVYYIDAHSKTNKRTQQKLPSDATNMRGVWSLKSNQYVIFPVKCGRTMYGYYLNKTLMNLFRNQNKLLKWAHGNTPPTNRTKRFNKLSPILYKPGNTPPNPIIETWNNVNPNMNMGLFKFDPNNTLNGRMRYFKGNVEHSFERIRLRNMIKNRPGIFFFGGCRSGRTKYVRNITHRENVKIKQKKTKRKRDNRKRGTPSPKSPVLSSANRKNVENMMRMLSRQVI